MRKKEIKTVVTFHVTADAIAFEKRCKELGIEGRLIPVPRVLSAGCGMAWASPLSEEERVRAAAEAGDIETEGIWQCEA